MIGKIRWPTRRTITEFTHIDEATHTACGIINRIELAAQVFSSSVARQDWNGLFGTMVQVFRIGHCHGCAIVFVELVSRIDRVVVALSWTNIMCLRLEVYGRLSSMSSFVDCLCWISNASPFWGGFVAR